MGLPDKPIKHIPVHQQPVGASRKGKLKVKDGNTGKVSWRSGKRGFLRDYDGDPTSNNYSNKDMAISHAVHSGKKRATTHNPPKDHQMKEFLDEE
jgi:hypothetical protein